MKKSLFSVIFGLLLLPSLSILSADLGYGLDRGVGYESEEEFTISCLCEQKCVCADLTDCDCYDECVCLWGGLASAVSSSDRRKAWLYLRAGISSSEQKIEQYSLVAWAALKGDILMLRVLIEEGNGKIDADAFALAADTRGTDNEYAVPLANKNPKAVIGYLLLKLEEKGDGTSINSLDQSSYTALMYAVASGDRDLIAYLLDKGARKDVKSEGSTAEELARDGDEYLENDPRPELANFIRDYIPKSV